MRVIFSRKGFDGTAGGCPSPLVDGRPVSLPIPTRMPSETKYGDLGRSIGELVRDLTNGRLTADSWCHHDPDIDDDALPRPQGWRGALGQVSAAQSHLARNGVGKGDLFIFWGLFRRVERAERWHFVGQPEHRIWGWLQVEDVIELGADGSHALRERPWLEGHPHVRPGWGKQNALYIGTEKLRLDGHELDLPGYGVLDRGFRLTAPDARPSTWIVPDWLHLRRGGLGMTYHPPERWLDGGILQAAARGQEFVCNGNLGACATEWVSDLLAERLR